jgi:hypothetical protein
VDRSGDERKLCFIKDDVPRRDHLAHDKVEAPVTFVIRWIADKSARCRPCPTFVVRRRCDVGEAEAPEDS